DAAVDVQVIGGGAFGRHAADNAECVHGVSFGWVRVQTAFCGLNGEKAACTWFFVLGCVSGCLFAI
ncbi:hypothetical protein, partial [Kingella denitrificans]|uniref:hypothetical protein n=1 Tax=Kingella denitrificans TaxID=502 RepID=UPI0028EC4F20